MYTYKFEAFTTLCELQLESDCELSANILADDILFHAKRLETNYSYFNENSELYQINHRDQNSLHVSDEFAGLLQLALFYSEITNGAFDVAMAGTLKDKRENYELIIPFASSACMKIDGNILTFSNSITKIDFGGLVKEYAVDQSMLILQLAGITSALVNFGGDIAVIGTCEGEKWSIGIQDPLNEHENIEIIKLETSSLCTSGHSKRYKEIDGKRFSHIITLEKNDLKQISIIAPTTIDAGVWSTALLANPELQLPNHIKIVSKVL